MVVACWSVKGGSGSTVVSACLAVVAAGVAERGTLLVDLAGDAPAALGVDATPSDGVTDWLETATVIGSDTGDPHVALPGVTQARTQTVVTHVDLAALEHRVDERLSLLAQGSRPVDAVAPPAGELLARRLAADGRFVVADLGTLSPSVTPGVAEEVVAAADRSVLVIRACYLALRRANRCARRIDGVVVVEEPGRSLTADDVAAVTGAPVLARIRCEPQIARVVDAGLLCSRVPRTVERAMSELAEA